MQGLYAIVDVPHPHGLDPADVAHAVLGDRPEGGVDGAAIVQLRAKHATTRERTAWLAAMAPVCARARVPLIANDDRDAATAADGLHLGQGDPGFDAVADLRARLRRGAIVGVSTHDLAQLRAALRQAPDYVAFGPVAATRSKAHPDPVVGFSGLADACRIASRPVVAIGGLDASGAERAIACGAAMVAMIGALVHPDVQATRAAAIALAQRLREAARPLSLEAVAAAIPVLSIELLAEIARWSDSLSVHLGLKLPARFGPRVVDGCATYRRSDVLDLCDALGKRPDETWDQWRERDGEVAAIVQLRRP